jgi:geranylgeranyl diphosphate synthase, type II
MNELRDFFAEVSTLVNAELDCLISSEGPGPRKLRDAIRWSLFGGGKQFRPALVFAVGRTLGAADEKLVRTAAAIEMIHTYSLIHDDLPSMDDDDLRRGRETCHKKFGEATAILAGDALQVLSFQAIAEDGRLPSEIRMGLIQGLSRAAVRMVVGQQHDLESEGKSLTLPEIEIIHINKTGALIAFSANAGAKIAGADGEVGKAISDYAEGLGLLFQITDDLLDVTASTEELGKTAGKDEAAGKATYPSVLGVEATRAKIAEVRERIVSVLEKVPADTSLLKSIGDFLVFRNF